MTSKQNYIAIARILNETNPDRIEKQDETTVAKFETWSDVACKLADYFDSDNPRFDRQRFLFACAKIDD